MDHLHSLDPSVGGSGPHGLTVRIVPHVLRPNASIATRLTSGDEWPSRPPCRGGLASLNHKYCISERRLFLPGELDSSGKTGGVFFRRPSCRGGNNRAVRRRPPPPAEGAWKLWRHETDMPRRTDDVRQGGRHRPSIARVAADMLKSPGTHPRASDRRRTGAARPPCSRRSAAATGRLEHQPTRQGAVEALPAQASRPGSDRMVS